MSRQRLGTLTPLAEIERWIEANVAAEPGGAELRVAQAVPPAPAAAIDGFAVSAEETFGATPYAPTALTQAIPVDQGDALPEGTDAVLSGKAVTTSASKAEASETVAPGENVRAEGLDGRPGELIRPAGAPRAITAAMTAGALGLGGAAPPRPMLLVVCVHANASDSPWPCELFGGFGCEVRSHGAETPALLGQALRSPGFDAIIVLGGTGEGSKDFAVATLAETGTLAFHGIALDPGETAALGRVDARPVLCLPGRPEAGLAAALTLGRSLVRRLKGAAPAPQPLMRGRLTRKVVAAPGRTRLVYADVTGDAVEPLGSSGLPLAVLARAIGYLILPPGSEGHPAGALVDVMPLPGYAPV